MSDNEATTDKTATDLAGRVESLVSWLLGRRYVFQHQNGMVRVVRARSIAAADRKMRVFVREQIFGPWALTYYPAMVERELEKFTVVYPANAAVKPPGPQE